MTRAGRALRRRSAAKCAAASAGTAHWKSGCPSPPPQGRDEIAARIKMKQQREGHSHPPRGETRIKLYLTVVSPHAVESYRWEDGVGDDHGGGRGGDAVRAALGLVVSPVANAQDDAVHETLRTLEKVHSMRALRCTATYTRARTHTHVVRAREDGAI